MKSRRSWWLIFGLGAMGVIAAMGWISLVVLRLEAGAQHEQKMRLALWRMDAWLGPRLRDEDNRAYYEYLSFYPQERAYTRILNAIQPGEVYSPSPLLTFESEIFSLHFQVDAAGALSSPQAPEGNWRDLAESGYIKPDFIARKQPLLDRVRTLIGPVSVEACVMEAESTLAKLMESEPMPPLTMPPPLPQSAGQQQQRGEGQGQMFVQNDNPIPWTQQQSAEFPNQSESQKVISKTEYQQRKGSKGAPQDSNVAPQQQTMMINDKEPPIVVEIGSLVPLWMATSAAPLESSSQAATPLLLVRRVRIGAQTLYQGMLVNWSRLRNELALQAADLLPQVELRPVQKPTMADVESGRMLGSLPVMMEAPCRMIAAGPLITPARTTLAITWLAVAIAVAAAGVTLRASIIYGEKRSRFASAVTHELRTPLTTFRMYSEMLAEGMVRDEVQRKTYLDTLKTESGRLATLVENVLSYARLEDGRAVSNAQCTTVAGLLERLGGVLSRRAAQGGMELKIANHAQDAAITIDVEAVGQILFNLVDNACKYANGTVDRTIRLDARVLDQTLEFIVRDHGPGIAPEHAKRIFAPFDRGAHGPGDTIPGVGLGLALARGLARDLGGELTLDRSNGGACFRLTAPVRLS